jgi:hypothetical protein
MKVERSLVALSVLLVLVSAVSATIINDTAPSWRGNVDTTTQAWGFDNDNNPADLEPGWVNPFGTSDPSAEVIGVDPPYGPPDFIAPDTYHIDSENGHQGLWRMYGDSELRIHIPNNPIANDYKEIWYQMTYYASGYTGAEPEFFVFPTETSETLISKIEVDPVNHYFHSIWSIIIEPNPDEEWITIKPRDCTIYIDEIIIDTICVPEPTTLVLLSFGGLSMLRKRKS